MGSDGAVAPARPRLLLAVSPRVLHDALREILGLGDVVEIVAGGSATGRFDLAVVSGPCRADAEVVIELLPAGGCAVLRRDGGDEVIELRDASGLVEVVSEVLGVGIPCVER